MALCPGPLEARQVTLLDLLDSALDRGVVVQGDATISVADVDLVFLGLKLVLTSVETMRSWRRQSDSGMEHGHSSPCGGPAIGIEHGHSSPCGGPAIGIEHGHSSPCGGPAIAAWSLGTPARAAPQARVPGPPASSPPLDGSGRPDSPAGSGDAPADVASGESEARTTAKAAQPRQDQAERGLAKLVLTIVELLRRLLEAQAVRRMQGGSLSEAEIERMGGVLQRLDRKMEELKRVFGLEGEELNLSLGPLGDLM